ncbi:hypothetical protein MKX01_000321 [Papaver californicum]|nr:hypothetical protein MKX01_000321 [Papaver californicum]
MKLHFIPILASLLVVVVVTQCAKGSYATHPSELYWQNMLPKTPIPKTVQDLLRPDFVEEKSTYVGVGKGGVNVDMKKPGGSGTSVGVGKGGVGVITNKPGGSGTSVGVGKGGVGVDTNKPGGSHTSVGVGKGGVVVVNRKPGGKGTAVNVGKGGVHIGIQNPKSGSGTTVNVGHKGGVGVDTGKPGGRTKVNVGKGGVSVNTRKKGKRPVTVYVHPGPNPFQYNYAASANQLQDDPNSALFFLEKDLHLGKKMNLQFVKTTSGATLLPRQLAKSIPFSSNKLTDILDQFSVDPSSEEAEVIKDTIRKCEEPTVAKEEKHCATSLESMIDFSTSKLGKNVNALATEINKEETKKQQYVIQSGVKKMNGDHAVVCHGQSYLYAVYFCHATHSSRAYTVPLVGADGTKVKAVAVCHIDTASWNPKHLAFQVLKVKPGTAPICHFLPEDHIVWTIKN